MGNFNIHNEAWEIIDKHYRDGDAFWIDEPVI